MSSHTLPNEPWLLSNKHWQVPVSSAGVGSSPSASILRTGGNFNILREGGLGRNGGTYWTADFGRTSDKKRIRYIPGVEESVAKMEWPTHHHERALHGDVPDTIAQLVGTPSSNQVIHEGFVENPRKIYVRKTTILSGKRYIQRLLVRNDDTRPYFSTIADHPFMADKPGNRLTLQSLTKRYARPIGGLLDPTPWEAPTAVILGSGVDFSVAKHVPANLDESAYGWDGAALLSWENGARVQLTATVSIYGLGEIAAPVQHRYTGQQTEHGSTALESSTGGANGDWLLRNGYLQREEVGTLQMPGQTVELIVVHEILDA